MSKQEIRGVVKNIISGYLNGSLDDAEKAYKSQRSKNPNLSQDKGKRKKKKASQAAGAEERTGLLQPCEGAHGNTE